MKCTICDQQIIDREAYVVQRIELDETDWVRDNSDDPVRIVVEEGFVCLGCSTISVDSVL